MAAEADPDSSGPDKVRAVELKRVHGRSPNGRPADDAHARLLPLEMISPYLVAGIEQPHDVTALGILSNDPRALVFIAE